METRARGISIRDICVDQASLRVPASDQDTSVCHDSALLAHVAINTMDRDRDNAAVSPRIVSKLPRQTCPTIRTATEPCQLPATGRNVVTQDVETPLRVLYLEVPVIGRQPAVDNFSELDLALSEPKPSRRLLTTMTSVALDIH
jgi:hypothetical protein